ncbi:MAG: HAD family hydrolase [Firmicutes bacterium]|nr:HAD family hydrolase [Bacillota bacterium]
MKPYAVFLDIDGTLVFQDQISNRVKEAIQQARSNGHFVFLCTGRTILGANSIPPIELDGAVISAGGYVEVQGKVLHHSWMKEELVQKAISLFEENHITYTLETDHATYLDEESMNAFILSFNADMDNSEIERMKAEMSQALNFQPLKDFKDKPVPVQTICFFVHSKDTLEKIKPELSDFYFILHGVSGDDYNCEINRTDADKGVGIQRILDYLQIPKERSIGFGDGMNDLAMLQTCGRGVAMGNANPGLKEVADAVCESVQEDGIYHELKRLGII